MNKMLRTLPVSLLLILLGAATGFASTLVDQTWLPGECIPQFQAALPVFGPGYNAALPRVDAKKYRKLTVKMVESSQQVLPNFTSEPGCPPVTIQPTKIWAYETYDSDHGKLLGPAHWPAVTVDAHRDHATKMTYVNKLPSGLASLQGLITVDQSIHWANPLGNTGAMICDSTPLPPECKAPYTGPVPAVPHLHGGEVPPMFDGGPDAWFTPEGIKGPAYFSLDSPPPGTAIYSYNNKQEPGTPWFHDHALGATRTNVYSGLAAFYFIRDPGNEPKDLPKDAYEIEMAIQDRMFDTNSQLFFPDGSGNKASNLNDPPPNPTIHPFWIPEFIGDVVVVNGAPWPVLKVEPRRYRFRIVDGSNARTYNLKFGAAPVYAIGADDGYLDAPVKVNSLLLAPGERADIIVDFTGLSNSDITVTNDACIPYPGGLCPGTDQPQMANIMRFSVTEPLRGCKGDKDVKVVIDDISCPVVPGQCDKSCNPAVPGQCGRPHPMVRLTDGRGNKKPEVVVDKVRQLVLKEHQGAGGPLEVLVNNAKWAAPITESPRVGSTELWEIINLTMDAHPMHTHLAQFQILNRQAFETNETLGYPAVWANAFKSTSKCPLGADFDSFDPLNPCPGGGPPLQYNTPNADGAVGGNPGIFSDLLGSPTPPKPEESGWKDTARALPGQVLRILVRWAPTSTPVKDAKAGKNKYHFDPTDGEYVWHCHIIDHEDNEMMRPYQVVP